MRSAVGTNGSQTRQAAAAAACVLCCAGSPGWGQARAPHLEHRGKAALDPRVMKHHIPVHRRHALGHILQQQLRLLLRSTCGVVQCWSHTSGGQTNSVKQANMAGAG